MNDNSSIEVLSEDAFNSLFETIPDKGVNADIIVGGKEKEPEVVKKTVENEVVAITRDNGGIESINDLDALFKGTDTENSKDESENKSEETDDANKTDESSDEDKETSKNQVLKSTVDYLIDKGLWLDFEGREELEVDDKTYGELVAKQDEARLNKLFNELIDSTGDYGKAIINHVKAGGNPEEIIDIFKEQKQIENFDVSNEDGQKALISKYYSEVLNWKSEKINRHITTLIGSNELETEVSDIKTLYDEYSQKELDKINQEQIVYQNKQKEIEDNFKNNITSTISSKKDLTEKERKVLQSSILDYKHKLPTGQVVSDFYLKFAEIQANPNTYVDLVSFVMDKQNYLKKLSTEIKNKEVDKAFNFVKGNSALTKTKGSSHEDVHRKDNKIAEFSFGLPKK